MNANASHRFINVIEKDEHRGELTLPSVTAFTENFAKPALFRSLVPVPERLLAKEFYEEIDPSQTLQWRRKTGSAPASIRSASGKADYNYVTGQVGTGAEFLSDVFDRKIDVYSHLGTISSGYNDPYEWGKRAFNRVQEEVFASGWMNVQGWRTTGHMFFGYSTTDYGETSQGAVGSDWHMFPSLNLFVMIAGRKKWMTRPPELLEQLDGEEYMFSTSSGREAPGAEFDHDTVYVEPGDVLLNPPYEWHKVLNARGLSLGAAFRIIDDDYIARLAQRRAFRANAPNFGDDHPEAVAHLLTSLRYCSFHINRAQMMLNEGEYVYSLLLKLMRLREIGSPAQTGQAQRAVAN
ncbi:MAG TPA: hypothetical protein VHC19_08465 [Pirellulales bacterium]|nr:hypothetical protein [Pirellulales bacterium]